MSDARDRFGRLRDTVAYIERSSRIQPAAWDCPRHPYERFGVTSCCDRCTPLSGESTKHDHEEEA